MKFKDIPLKQLAAKECGWALAAVWIIGWSAIILFFDVVAGRSIVRQQMAIDYPSTEGTISNSEIDIQHDEDGTAYRPEISYEYISPRWPNRAGTA